MELSLTKLPWYAQIGAFVVLAGVGAGLFYQYYEVPTRAEMATRETQLKGLKADIAKGLETAKKLPEFRSQVDDLEARLGNLRAVLPEEKDAGDLLRRLQTVASQSSGVHLLTLFGTFTQGGTTLSLALPGTLPATLTGPIDPVTGVFTLDGGPFTAAGAPPGPHAFFTGTADPNTTIAAKCTATTFVLLDKPTPPKPGAPGAPGTQKPPAPGTKAD